MHLHTDTERCPTNRADQAALLLRNARCLHLLQYGGRTAKPCDRACGSDTFWFTSLTPLISFLPASAVTNCHDLGSLKQHKSVTSLFILEARSLQWVSRGQNRGAHRAAFLSRGSRQEFIFLSFLDSRSCQRSVARGPLPSSKPAAR